MRRPRARRGYDLFKADQSGAAALEFAMVIMPFLAFVFLVVQAALYQFGNQTLEFATGIAARSVMVGGVSARANSASGFKSELLCPHLSGLLECDKIVVNAYKVASTSAAISSSDIARFIDGRGVLLTNALTETSFCLGGGGDYVFIDVSYKMPALIGGLFLGASPSDNVLLMRSSAFIRNEPGRRRRASC